MNRPAEPRSCTSLADTENRWLGRVVRFALLIFALRVLYLILDNPYELAGDEAQYWDWSRRIDWSYYSKGPGIAWLIGLSTRLFGHEAWAVRFPAAVSGSLTILACGWMTARLGHGQPRAPFYAAVMAAFAPFLFATSQFMTIDAPFFAAWAIAAAIALRILTTSRSTLWLWCALGITVGVGVLLKYTMLLLIPGLVIGFVSACRLRPGLRLGRSGPLLAVVLALVTMLPIAIWNQMNGWPTVAHLLGHLGAPGGDLEPARRWFYNPLWTLEAVAVQMLLIAPGISLLVILALRRVSFVDDPTRSGIRLLTWMAWPVFGLYFLVSFATNVEANWPAAGWITLIPVAAVGLPTRLCSPGYNPWKFGWHAILTIAVIAAPLILFGPHLMRAPGVHLLPFHGAIEKGLQRVSRSEEEALCVAEIQQRIAEETGLDPFIVGAHYGRAALIAYYHPGHPVVFSGASALGDRESSYDYFADTSLEREDLLGRPAILIGTQPRKWVTGLVFERIEALPDHRDISVGYGYLGTTESFDER
ncbi:ArnT family glycosyltransferase [Mucisphaera calidilacus]|uniref:Undecaprenyl phosphate-alpha-4-amino-4-deoxy-L-arabinose arabinosyl transferase n=1 Tax=Mucisphaera calidilacus TaxID=2527982 RepID=A0A518BYL6_9BACT|nr:glycosyltransferase family 39 protein [Mucisphaera calidilacus]QDU72069.1 Undecaprenyl phosphate-alpha-4-amino-4-deoxy-L-arabinose arabinosyl transferase [Mucisphaera calidilacus]